MTDFVTIRCRDLWIRVPVAIAERRGYTDGQELDYEAFTAVCNMVIGYQIRDRE